MPRGHVAHPPARVWIDLANTPHVPLLRPLVARLEEEGHEVLLTCRDHAQTLELARRAWPGIRVIGSGSPDGRLQKGAGILRRARDLGAYARGRRPDVAFSHGSYAQILAARATRVPAVTMMDYEFQPANHLSFRLAHRVIVPEAFDGAQLRRAGARAAKVVRYPGFKEQLYLTGEPDTAGVAAELGLDPAKVIVVMRPAPEGALYHRMENERFDEIVRDALARPDTEVVILPRQPQQAERLRRDHPRALIPERAPDGHALLALADVTIGAGGTMTRESAVLGTPTYTVFAGRLAGVDAELLRRGLLHDLRDAASRPRFVKKSARPGANDGAAAIADTVLRTILERVP